MVYKKDKVVEKKQGQLRLAKYIRALNASEVLELTTSAEVTEYLSQESILSKAVKAMKQNEDALDSIICAYIGALYASEMPGRLFGTVEVGYIDVPAQKCI